MLMSLRAGGELPPVQLERIQDSRYTYQLVDGFHRYCGSIAGRFHEISWCRPDRGASIGRLRSTAARAGDR
jgi:hypothetical protein